MAIKIYKPTTPGLRGMTGYTFEEITKDKPERSLIIIRSEHAGRNANGRITVRHRGAGDRQYIRLVDFKREKHGIPAKRGAIEYDPNRTARLALLIYADGEKRYIVAPLGLKVGEPSFPARSRDPSREQPADFQYSCWYPDPQHGNEITERAANSSALPVAPLNCWRKKAIMPRCVYLPGKSA